MTLAKLRLLMVAYALAAGTATALVLAPTLASDAATIMQPTPSLEIPVDLNDLVVRTPPVPAVVPANPALTR